MYATDITEGQVAAQEHWGRAITICVIAGLGLSIGALVYLTDRAAYSHSLLPRFASLQRRHLFGVVGPWLPSFLHTFSFSLLTAAARSPAKSPAYGACAAWCTVNLVFELGQHPKVSQRLADLVLRTFGDTAPSRWTSNFFIRGTFDVNDIAAAVAGGLAAAGLLHLVHSPRRAT